MSILTREEFHERMLAYGGDVVEYNSTDIRTFAQGRAVDTSAGRVMAAYDAALARIAELEEKNAIQALHIEAIGKELIEANAVCDAWEAQAHGK